MIAIIDYGMGNLGSIANMLRKIGAQAVISSDPDVIGAAERLILPGVGAFAHGMANLEARGLIPVLQQRVVQERAPILGICLGMQLFTRSSEEGGVAGLGWIDATTKRLRAEEVGRRVPHMGWNSICARREHWLLADLPPDPRFYFVHSYRVACENEGDALCSTHYGIEFTSGIARDNIIGTQFHPEKSHRFGYHLLQSFAFAA